MFSEEQDVEHIECVLQTLYDANLKISGENWHFSRTVSNI